MNRYIVKITEDALSDMEQIYNYIAYDLLSPESAIRQYNRIADAILTLDTMPTRIKVIDNIIVRNKALRRMLVDNYSVFFVIQGEQVIITNVLYSASDINQRLI